MDFLENGAIEKFNKAQSEHWQIQYLTHFMLIILWLKSDDWNKVDRILKTNDEITVKGKFMRLSRLGLTSVSVLEPVSRFR